MSLPWGVRRVAIHYQISSAPYTMRMRLMLLGGGNALGQALIRLGAEEDIGFLAPRPPEQAGMPPASPPCWTKRAPTR